VSVKAPNHWRFVHSRLASRLRTERLTVAHLEGVTFEQVKDAGRRRRR